MSPKKTRPDSFTFGTTVVSRRADRGYDKAGRGYWTFRRRDEQGVQHTIPLGRLADQDVEVAYDRVKRVSVASRAAAAEEDAAGAPIRTVRDMIKRWLAYQNKRVRADRLRVSTYETWTSNAGVAMYHLGDVPAARLRRGHIEDMDLDLIAGGRAPGTSFNICSVVAMAQNWAVDREMIVAPSIKFRAGERPSPHAQQAASAEQCAELLKLVRAADAARPPGAGRPWLTLYTELVAWSGARPAEVALLLASSWSKDCEIFTIPNQLGAKTGTRSPAIPAELADRVVAFIEGMAPEARMFPANAAEQVRKRMREAGMTWTLYALRKARHDALDRTPGVTQADMDAQLGNSAEQRRKRYTSSSPERLVDLQTRALPAITTEEERAAQAAASNVKPFRR